jgi:hypothetical protein
VSVATKSVWLGAAALGVGLALTGPEVPSAVADTGARDSVSAPSAAGSPPAQSVRRGRAVRSGPRPAAPTAAADRSGSSIAAVSKKTDKNYESHVNESGTVIRDRVIPDEFTDPAEFSDILKFSDSTDILVENSTIFGGREDSIDAVRGARYTFRNLTLVPDYNGITVKGSADGVRIENVSFTKHGSSSDMEFGQFDNYWYIGRPPTRNIAINNVSATDGKPVVIVLWDSERPTVVDSNVRIVKIPKIIWWPYFVIRAIQTRGLKNIWTPVKAGISVTTT